MNVKFDIEVIGHVEIKKKDGSIIRHIHNHDEGNDGLTGTHIINESANVKRELYNIFANVILSLISYPNMCKKIKISKNLYNRFKEVKNLIITHEEYRYGQLDYMDYGTRHFKLCIEDLLEDDDKIILDMGEYNFLFIERDDNISDKQSLDEYHNFESFIIRNIKI